MRETREGKRCYLLPFPPFPSMYFYIFQGTVIFLQVEGWLREMDMSVGDRLVKYQGSGLALCPKGVRNGGGTGL